MHLCAVLYSYHHHHHQSVLPKGRSFTANAGTKDAVLSKGKPSTANSETKVAILLWINRCGNFSLLSTPTLSLASEKALKDLKISQGSQCAGEESWFGYLSPRDYRNSPQGLNISSIKVFDQIRYPELPVTLRPHIHIGPRLT